VTSGAVLSVGNIDIFIGYVGSSDDISVNSNNGTVALDENLSDA
jgi:hypothetical protein